MSSLAHAGARRYSGANLGFANPRFRPLASCPTPSSQPAVGTPQGVPQTPQDVPRTPYSRLSALDSSLAVISTIGIIRS